VNRRLTNVQPQNHEVNFAFCNPLAFIIRTSIFVNLRFTPAAASALRGTKKFLVFKRKIRAIRSNKDSPMLYVESWLVALNRLVIGRTVCDWRPHAKER
jgi:hypothetical protein